MNLLDCGQMFSSLNGLLLPGGSAPLVGHGGYAEAGQIFFELAKEVGGRLGELCRPQRLETPSPSLAHVTGLSC